MSNSRRRVLGLLGLIGVLPVSAWAQSTSSSSSSSSSADPPMVSCSVSTETPTYELRYTNTFELNDGRLTSSYGDALMSVSAAPVSQSFTPPFRDGATPGSSDIVDTYHPLISVTLNSTIGSGPSFHANIIVPSATAKGVAQMRDKDGALLGEVDIDSETPGDDPLNLTYSGLFNGAVVPSLQAGPVEIRILLDGQIAATYTYDVSHVDWRPYMAEQDAAFAAKTGVTLDEDGISNVEGCDDDSGCFFTTAASLTLGLGDDCWELRTLRTFRDGPLAKTVTGRALITRYYLEAPRLVAAIDRRPDAARVWLRKYWSHVLPCAILARLGLVGPAVAHYTRLFNRLEQLA